MRNWMKSNGNYINLECFIQPHYCKDITMNCIKIHCTKSQTCSLFTSASLAFDALILSDFNSFPLGVLSLQISSAVCQKLITALAKLLAVLFFLRNKFSCLNFARPQEAINLEIREATVVFHNRSCLKLV